MLRFLNLFYYILAFLSPFGSANLFKLRSAAERTNEQNSILPIIFVVCILLSLCNTNVRNKYKLTKPLAYPLFAFYIVFAFAGLLSEYSDNLPEIIYLIKLFIAILGFLIISQTFIAYPKLLYRSVAIYAYTSVIIVVAFFLGLLEGGYYYSNGRLWFLGINPNTYSFMMGFALLILIYFAHRKDLKNIYRIINILFAIPILLFILLSGSRGSLIFVSLSIFIILYKQILNRFLIYLISMLAIVVALSVISSKMELEISTFERLETLGERGSREDLIGKTLSVFEKNPILGVGAIGYKNLMKKQFREERDAHNVVLVTLAMSGIIGLSFYLMFLCSLFKNAIKRSKNRILSFSIVLYMCLISLKTGSVLTYSLMWYIYAIALSYNVIGRENKTISFRG